MSDSPMMMQYYAHKKEAEDAILLYRVGDFYETFAEDAKTVSEVLNITLTSRNNGSASKIPLAGFPCHALDKYITKLVCAGYKVAIGEQVEDPKLAKKLVKRDIVEIITPGTTIDANFLEETTTNYLLAIHIVEEKAYLCFGDITTGNLYTEICVYSNLENRISVIKPSEIIVCENLRNNLDIIKLKNNLAFLTAISYAPDYYFSQTQALPFLKEHFHLNSFENFGYDSNDLSLIVASALLKYAKVNKKNELEYINRLIKNDNAKKLALDYSAIRNLELVDPLFAEDKDSTLFSVIKKTNTAMGTRLLKKWIINPLLDKEEIEARLRAVEILTEDFALRDSLTTYLRMILDLERISGRISYKRVNPKELIALKNSLEVIPKIVKLLQEKEGLLKELVLNFPNMQAGFDLINLAINNDPPTLLRDGKIIKSGYNKQLDEIKERLKNSKQRLIDLENAEKEKTKIPKLKISYSKIYGYYFEVSKAQLNNVPDYFIRKQTLVNAERFVTEELKNEEDFILTSETTLNDLEYQIFMEVIEELGKFIVDFQVVAEKIAIIDNLNGFAKVAIENNYCKPVIQNGGDFVISEGRHPVVEKLIEKDQFIPNDTFLNNQNSQIMIITGPNMAGKSTYLRQNALIAIMTQIGSFVPAKYAKIPLIDKIYTRIGAFDRLSKGQSTFLVEMSEVANILNNTTEKSLIILDEVGRGTSTFDGLSLAWSIIEYLHEQKGKRAKTIFATHYHELTEMETLFKNIVNFNVSIQRDGDNLIFLRKVNQGSASDSYGIDVANLAGVPYEVISRAKEVLKSVEETPIKVIEERKQDKILDDGALFDTQNIKKDSIIEQFKKVQPDNLTPIEALNLIYKLKSEIKKI